MFVAITAVHMEPTVRGGSGGERHYQRNPMFPIPARTADNEMFLCKISNHIQGSNISSHPAKNGILSVFWPTESFRKRDTMSVPSFLVSERNGP